MLEGNPNIPGIPIAVNVTLTIKLYNANYIIDLSYTLSHSFQLILSVSVSVCLSVSLSLSLSVSVWVRLCVHRKEKINKGPDVISAVDSTVHQFKQMKTNCINQLITLKLRRLKSIVVIKCSSLFSYNAFIWTLILTSQNSTPEYLTGTRTLLSEVDRNVVCCDYDSTILGKSYYHVILFQRVHCS